MSQDASLLQSNQQVEQHLHLAGQFAIRYSGGRDMTRTIYVRWV